MHTSLHVPFLSPPWWRAVGLICILAVPGAAGAFGLADVQAKAADLASRAYEPPKKIPKFLHDIDYDTLRDIRYKPNYTLWRSPRMNFDVQFFHPGMVYEHAVAIHYVDREGVHDVPFSVERFDYGPRARHLRHRVPPDLGYAGFRIYYPLNNPGVQDEVIAFLGASYFRAVPRAGRYGLSARGLAIDTALEDGEEFPFFREFWIERPRRGSHHIRIYALLDSPSVTGAYRFTVFPGEPTRVDVTLRLFPRREIQELGIAPLTSMFFYGENTPRPSGQWRPEVHDSDGLVLVDGTGECIWRPLINGPRLRMALFSLTDPRRFGLLQRDRNFYSYQDLETRMELRPSAWVVPYGNWGEGRVKLVEIPTRNEYNDNVVVYWTKGRPVKAGERVALSYRIEWSMHPMAPCDANARVVNTWVGREEKTGRRHFVVDFAGAVFDTLEPGVDVVPVVSGGENAEITELTAARNEVSGGWRIAFQVKPTDEYPVELRAYLRYGDEAISETWSYLLQEESE